MYNILSQVCEFVLRDHDAKSKRQRSDRCMNREQNHEERGFTARVELKTLLTPRKSENGKHGLNLKLKNSTERNSFK